VRRPAFSVLVIPYALDAFAEVAFALLRRDEDGGWHVRTGWGARSESPPEAARRVAGVQGAASLLALDSRAMVVAEGFPAACQLPEYAFALRTDPVELPAQAGNEQVWFSYRIAHGLLPRRAERDALWELQRRLGLAPAYR
jgi:hypothetical protein